MRRVGLRPMLGAMRLVLVAFGTTPPRTPGRSVLGGLRHPLLDDDDDDHLVGFRPYCCHHLQGLVKLGFIPSLRPTNNPFSK